MTVRDLILRQASEYGIRAAHQAELADTGDDEAEQAALVFTVVELVLREIADTIEEAAA